MCKILILLLFLIPLLSCKTGEPETQKLFIHGKTEWTYAMYMAADNNLERFALKNIKEIKENLDSQEINFVVLLDRANGYDKTEGNWTDTKILELNSGTEINDDIILELGEKDTTDISTLNEFLEFVTKYYPSEKFALNIWSHGFGVYPDCKIFYESRSLIQDYTTRYSNECAFSIIEFADCLRNFCNIQNKKIDILQFDCCLMQMVEILWQLKDCADFIIGSQAELPGSGSNYTTLCKNLTSNFTTKECAANIVDDFKEKYKNTLVSCSYSAVDMNNFQKFANSFNSFFNNISENTNINFSLLKNNIEKSYKYDSNFIEYIDLINFLSIFKEQLTNNPKEEEVFFQLTESFNEITLSSYSGNSYSEKINGIGINIPYNEKLYSYYNQQADDYLDIYKDTPLIQIIEKIVFAE